MHGDVERVTLVRGDGSAVRFAGLVVYGRETVDGALERIERETGLRLDGFERDKMEPSMATRHTTAEIIELEDRLARALQLLHDVEDLHRHDCLTEREFRVMAVHLAQQRNSIMSDEEFYDLREQVNRRVDTALEVRHVD